MSTLHWADTLNRLVGQRIAGFREQHEPDKLTQQALAAATRGRISRSTLANIERGHQSASLIQVFVLADALGVEPNALLPSRSEVLNAAPSTLEVDLAQQPREARAWLKQMRSGLNVVKGGDRA